MVIAREALMKMQTHEYADAARAIKTGLQLPLPEDLTATQKEKLVICEFEVNKSPIEWNSTVTLART